jgi:hypothetical protein
MAALVAFAIVGAARPATAQTAAPPPSPNSVLLAKQILELKGISQVFQPLVRGVVVKVRDAFMQTNFMWAKDLNEVAANLQKQYDGRTSELVDGAAKIYASHFTEQELKDILTFYQSPLGQKVIHEEPKAADESMNNAQKFADNLSLEVIDSLRSEMKKRGHDL